MYKLFILFLIGTSFLTSAQDLSLSTSNAHVDFNYFSKSTEGTLSNVTAEINLKFSDLSHSVISGSVEVATLSTENNSRDEHLKSDDFFDVEKYPTMKFQSSEIYIEEGNYFVKGTLTIKDVEEEVLFALTVNETSITLTTEIYALDFGVATKKDREHSRVGVSIVIVIE